VDENRKIHMKVPLHFVNGEDSPAVKTMDAIISHVLTEVDVSCLPKDLPTFIEVDLSQLAVGQSIHVSDIKLPDNVSAVSRHGGNPVVATAIVPRVVAETEETAPKAEAGAEAGAPDVAKAGDKAADKGADKGGDKASDKGGSKKDDKK